MTGLVKLFAVVPLTCVVPPTATLAPVVVNVATNAVTSVPKGTVTAMLVPLITPAAAGLVNENAVMAFAEDKAAGGVQFEGAGGLTSSTPHPPRTMANEAMTGMRTKKNIFFIRTPPGTIRL